MSGRKKKLSAKLMNYNIVLIGALFVLVVFLSLLMASKMVGNPDYYLMESRITNIEKAKQNDDDSHQTIAWVRVQGTNIDYPVFGEITDDFDTTNVYDSFLWSLNDDSKFHNSLFFFGHNVMNLGPFPRQHDSSFTRAEELMNFVYYDFAKENQYMQLTMDGKTYLYKIFAVSFFSVTDLLEVPKGEMTSFQKNAFLNMLKEKTIYDYDINVSNEDDLLTVATCTRFFMDKNYNFLVTGRMVRSGEAIDNYKVHRNKNYDKIDDVLKGADESESEYN